MIVEAESKEGSTADLVREVIADAKELTKLEVALAKNEAIREMKALKTSVIAFGVAGVCILLAIVCLLMTVALALGSWLFTLLVGLVFLAAAAVGGAMGVNHLPRKPLVETRERLQSDAQQLKERVA